ncbi:MULTISPECIES: CsbD family protein [Paracoccus]|uniref:CsbD family protein n=1 Tax=Paracoccus onubensis TaxID=1675788 RepID=A0A418SSU0_9RHOB|nr:CsbD family protein [Paracoccus onubensis]MDP0928996.1 CsbD family protein [Paracoccus onubensis]RJE84040.1 CsbD family protein [Paracoccus onubensis]
MNWDIIQGKWQQFKGSVKQQWGDLTDDEIDQIAGDRDKLTGKLQEKYGWAKEDADRHIDDFFRDKS